MSYFIAIDGLDGSGKATQSKLLADALENEGKKVKRLSFPMYESKSSTFVKMYLSGELGKKADDTNAFAASTLFALDRYISFKTDWASDYASDDTIVLADRFTSANAVHQLSKLECSLWNDFLNWLNDFEYNKLTIPSPDMVIYLEVKPEISIELIKSRSAQTGRQMDIHELDPKFLFKSYDAAMYASDALGWTKIRCYNGSCMRSVEEIAKDIRIAVNNKLGI